VVFRGHCQEPVGFQCLPQCNDLTKHYNYNIMFFMIGYKLFRVRKNGTIGSLFINRKAVVPINKWLKSEEHPTKGFAIRAGWHITHAPVAPHLSKKGRCWYKVEFKNYQKLKRPKNQGGMWYLAKCMRVIGEMNE
jgi:hypothetical protein